MTKKELKELTRYIPRDRMEDFDERAGIMQFCGGMKKDEAERAAVKIVLAEGRQRRRRA